LLGGLFIIGASFSANANLITNGTFDTNLDDWNITVVSGTSGVTFDNQTAHVGRPGTPGTVDFFQFFDLPTASKSVNISFDYQWQVTPPSVDDFFYATFGYSQNGIGQVNTQVLTDVSSSAVFGQTVNFSTTVNVSNIDFAGGGNNAILNFKLFENNSPVGTRIQLDNVSVTAVPTPGTLALLGMGLVGFFGLRRSNACG
jgi:hypothetical protein